MKHITIAGICNFETKSQFLAFISWNSGSAGRSSFKSDWRRIREPDNFSFLKPDMFPFCFSGSKHSLQPHSVSWNFQSFLCFHFGTVRLHLIMTNEDRRTVIESPNFTFFSIHINRTDGRNLQFMVTSLDATSEVRTTDPRWIQYILYFKCYCCFPCKSLLRKKMLKFHLSSMRNKYWMTTDQN